MKILFLTKYSRLGASSRYRALQFFPYLEANGCSISCQHFLRDSYIENFYRTGRRSSLEGGHSMLRRIWYVLRHHLSHFDVIHLQAELLPRIPYALESIFIRNRARWVVDYDDAVFEHYRHNPLLRHKIGRVVESATHVIVANDYLRSYVSCFSTRVNVLPTVIDLSKYHGRDDYRLQPDRPLVIGWIGSPATVHYLASFANVLRVLSQRHRILLRCVGAPPDLRIAGVPVEHLPWSEASEAQLIRTFDIGIMPLTSEPFAKGKSGLKLIQYMGCGVPAIGAAVGANAQIISDGDNGLLASSSQEYIAKIETLIADSGLRERLGRAGRRTVESRYSLQAVAPEFLRLLTSVAQVRSAACIAPLSCAT